MDKNRNNPKRAFTISEAAQHACVSRGIIESWLVQGLLPFEELPGTGESKGVQRFRRIRRVDLEDFLDKFHHPARQEALSCNDKKTDRPVILLSRTSLLEKRHGSP